MLFKLIAIGLIIVGTILIEIAFEKLIKIDFSPIPTHKKIAYAVMQHLSGGIMLTVIWFACS